MKRIESSVKHISSPQELVYAKMADLSNLGELAKNIPADQQEQLKVENLECTPDRVSCSISPIGKIEIGVVSREPYKCVKMETIKSPVKMTLWIQIVSTGTSSCKIKLTADADLNIIMAKMVQKPMAEAIEKIAEMLAMIPY